MKNLRFSFFYDRSERTNNTYTRKGKKKNIDNSNMHHR